MSSGKHPPIGAADSVGEDPPVLAADLGEAPPLSGGRLLGLVKALEVARQYGQIDGAHHKAWVIDQMVRELLIHEADYERFIYEYQYLDDDGNESGEMIYEWDEGIAP